MKFTSQSVNITRYVHCCWRQSSSVRRLGYMLEDRNQGSVSDRGKR